MDEKYTLPEEQNNRVNECSIEYLAQNEAVLKMEAVQNIMNVMDLNSLRLIVDYIKGIVGKTSPCQFTIDQLKNELEQSEKDIREGNVYTMEELRKFHPLC